MSGDPFSFSRAWEGFLPPNAVVMAKRRATSPAHEETAAAVRYGFEAPGIESGAARELFDKIMAALGLAAPDFAVHAELPADFGATVVVRFAAAAGEKGAGVWDGNVLTTYSLSAMLADPGLKKPVWAHVREAIARGGKS